MTKASFASPRRPLIATVAITLALCLGQTVSNGAGMDGVQEPDAYKTDNYRSAVPKSLTGAASVPEPEAAKALLAAGAVFVDVYPRAPKPPNLPASTVWREPPHRSIPGATWLPNVGYGVISEETQVYFTAQLHRLTGGSKAKPLVFFCLSDCWMSWNAAKRAIAMGHTAVHWFPDGTDGWELIGEPLVDVTPAK